MNRFYQVMYTLFKPLFCLLFPVEVKGREQVPAGGALICPNHAHALDPVIVCVGLGKRDRIHLMAKQQLLRIPVLGAFLRALGAYGVDRGHSDIQSIKESIRFLKEGDKLIIFPEGTRVEKEGDARAKGGVAMLAARTGTPLVPVYCGGKKRLFHKTTLIFGAPYQPVIEGKRSTPEENQKIADEVLRRAYALGRQA